jgi:hypothetical protein
MVSDNFLSRLRKINAYLCPESNEYWSINSIYDEFPYSLKKDIYKALEQAEKNYKEWLLLKDI